MLVAIVSTTENKIQPKVTLFLSLSFSLLFSPFVLTHATISISVRSIIYRPHFFSGIIKTGGTRKRETRTLMKIVTDTKIIRNGGKRQLILTRTIDKGEFHKTHGKRIIIHFCAYQFLVPRIFLNRRSTGHVKIRSANPERIYL